MRRRFSLPHNANHHARQARKRLQQLQFFPVSRYFFLVLFLALGIVFMVNLSNSKPNFSLPNLRQEVNSSKERVDFAVAGSPDAPILVGAGKATINLPIGEINMQGYAEMAQNANGIHLRLKARAFIFTNPETPNHRAVYVCADIGHMSSIARQDIIQKLNTPEFSDPTTNQTYYTLENLMISASHTHAGAGGFSDEFLYQITSLGRVPMAREALVDGVLNSIRAAHKQLERSLKAVETQRVVISSGNVVGASINRSPMAYLENPEEERRRYESNVDQKMVGVSVWYGKDRERKNLKANVNWFAVHGTSLHSLNSLVSGDNKGFAGYLWELEEKRRGNEEFVSAFAQTNSGDVSPNLLPPRCIDTGIPCDGSKGSCGGDVSKCLARGPGEDNGKDDFYSAEYIGRQQYEKAQQITTQTDGLETRGPILFRHAWVDLSDILVELPNGTVAKTCTPAMGYAFAAGTTDGKGTMLSYQGYNKRDKNVILKFLKDLLLSRPVSHEQERCHHPKQILINTGDNNVPYPWQPKTVPLQLFVVGRKFAIVGLPSEITTMAGRRLRESVKQALVNDRVIDEDAEIVISALTNAYSSYITTFEEYQFQRYEGGSTIFGPYTLLAYQKLFTQMAHSFTSPSLGLRSAPPPNKPEHEVSLLSPVILDAVRSGHRFGDALAHPDRLIYHIPPARSLAVDSEVGTLGDGNVTNRIKNSTTIVRASFLCAHPRNGEGYVSPVTGDPSFMTVEKQNKDDHSVWNEYLTDAEWDTKYIWTRSGMAESICDVEWDIGRTIPAEPGIYRFRVYGIAKTLFGEKKFEGTSLSFALLESDEGLVIQKSKR